MESITPQDVPIAIEGDGVEFRKRPAGAMSVSFVRLPMGADLSPMLEGLPDDLCQCPHWGYMIKGRVRMHTKDGDRDYEAGRAFYWAPGHAPQALEDSEYVDFSPTHELDEVVQHVQRRAQAAAG
jgi:hypothetical protein